MKENLENAFKKALDQHELPYDPSAWSRLETQLPASKSHWLTLKKSGLFGAAVLLVATYLLWPTSAPKKVSQDTSVASHAPSASSKVQHPTVQTSHSQAQASSTAFNTDHQTTQPTQGAQLAQGTEMHQALENPLALTNQTLQPERTPQLSSHSIPFFQYPSQSPELKAQSTEIESGFKCQGETFTYSTTTWEVVIVYAGQRYELDRNQAFQLQLTQPGKLSVSVFNGPYGQASIEAEYTVQAKPTLSMVVEAINYEDGCPRIQLQVESNATALDWKASGPLQNQSNRGADLLAFREGSYSIQTIAHLGECSSAENLRIQQPEEYNLLAVNAFNPNSLDERNAHFMPFALTKRQTPFRMVILDPETGAIVFESSDANNAWDGIDQRNGKLIPAQKSYIWKVVLAHPLPGEKSEYKGTIVRV
ncbi:MAG: hypothetical protein RLZZ301_1082 [Bacteroidota bacterium]|jgi:hypothetical protein